MPKKKVVIQEVQQVQEAIPVEIPVAIPVKEVANATIVSEIVQASSENSPEIVQEALPVNLDKVEVQIPALGVTTSDTLTVDAFKFKELSPVVVENYIEITLTEKEVDGKHAHNISVDARWSDSHHFLDMIAKAILCWVESEHKQQEAENDKH